MTICLKLISEHEPRKGTETWLAATGVAVEMAVFQNTNPERGRKRLPKSAIDFEAELISEHEPRKGTETNQTD